MVLVTEISHRIHGDTGSHVWWSNQALGGSNTKAHAIPQDKRKKVGKGVRIDRRQAKQSRKAPDL